MTRTHNTPNAYVYCDFKQRQDVAQEETPKLLEQQR